MNQQELLFLFLLGIIFLLLIITLIFIARRSQSGQVELLQLINKQNNDLIDRVDARFDGSSDYLMSQTLKLNEIVNDFSKEIKEMNHKNYLEINQHLTQRLEIIDKKMMSNIETSTTSFNHVLERLVKINEAQKIIDTLSEDISGLQSILTSKQARGLFGEIQLNQILESVFGEKNDKIYQTQYTFFNGVRSDAVIFAPKPLGTVAIDSKFPLDNYRRLTDQELPEHKRQLASRNFVSDVKKHIDDVANKYIIEEVTSNQALLFIPAEAVFSTIHAYHPDIITYANSKRVWLVSPTTLMATLTTIQTVLMNIERSQYTEEIHRHLKGLQIEFDRYQTRWNELSRHFDLLGKDIKDIHVTSQKISKTFDRINTVEIDKGKKEHDTIK